MMPPMDERPVPAPARNQRQVAGTNSSGDSFRPLAGPLADPRALTILTTEHWSLLSARGLVYNEAFSRSGMFLTFVSGTFVALGLASTATGFSHEFLAVVVIALGLDLFVGLATMGRAMDASREDLRCLQGMNRIRHAYVEMVPDLERYFVSSHYDDDRAVFGGYGPATLGSPAGIVHSFTTTMGMLAVINASIGGILVGVLALLADAGAATAIGAGIVTTTVLIGSQVALMGTRVRRFTQSLQPAFPSPPAEPASRVAGDGDTAGCPTS